MGIRFVTPESVRLPLSDGDFIDVKKRLTHGEQDAMFGRMAQFSVSGQPILDAKSVRAIKVVTYLLGWSSAVPMALTMPESERLDILNSLDPDAFNEIAEAIDTHIAAMDLARAQEKKLAGPSVSAPNFASVGR